MAERFSFLVKAYNQSEWKERVCKETELILDEYRQRVAEKAEQPMKALDYANGWGHQVSQHFVNICT